MESTKQKRDNEEINNYTHEFISREYISQPYGTCLCCGITVLGNNSTHNLVDNE